MTVVCSIKFSCVQMATHSGAHENEEEGFLDSFQQADIRYTEIGIIRSGDYGTVFKARTLRTNALVSVHVMKIQMSEEGFPASTLREISLLRGLGFKHPNVVELLDIGNGRRVRKDNQLLLPFVFEHVDENLAGVLEKCPAPGLGSETIKKISFEILCGIDYLHHNGVVHKNLNPSNILVSGNCDVKLADFGLSSIYDSWTTLTSSVPSLWYCPPERLLRPSLAFSGPMWRAGCIIAEMFKGKPLFVGENEVDQLTKILEIIGSPPEAEWPQYASIAWSSFKVYEGIPFPIVIPNVCEDGTDLLKTMLMFNRRSRISHRAALCHSYFQDYINNLPRPLLCSLFGTSYAPWFGSEHSRKCESFTIFWCIPFAAHLSDEN